MARTITAIYDEIIAEKNSMSELSNLLPNLETPGSSPASELLSELSSGSKVAIWRLWAFVTAVAIWIHEKLWDAFRGEVDTLIANAIPGTARWYRDMCLAFQLGDEMIYSNYKYSYPAIDTDKQIVKRASVQELGGDLLAKVATDTGGVIEPLTQPQYDAFVAYLQKVKFAGTFISVVSQEADLLNVALTVIYDPMILNSSGQLLSDTSVEPVKEAIENYLASLPWDGIFRNSAMIDAVQQASGVVDVVLESAEAKGNAAANYNAISRAYQTVSGHIKLNNLNVAWNV
jgi:hypothetical protein